MFKSFGRRSRRTVRQDPVDRLRQDADLARDTKDWSAAAERYETYLHSRPDDGPIWVQLGHARKEAGDRDGARSAYAQALERMPDDADLLLNIGHLNKLDGRTEEAASFYTQSLSANFSVDALREVMAHQSPARAEPLPTTPLDLQPLCHGLKVTAVNDLLLDEDGVYRMTSSDPNIRFTPRGNVDAPLGALRIELSSNQPAERSGKLYIDYGEGVSENHAIELQDWESESGVSLLLARPGEIAAIRWDPDDQPGRLPLVGLRFWTLHDEDDLAAFTGDDRLDPEVASALGRTAETYFDGQFGERRSTPAFAQMDLPWQFANISHDYGYWRELYANPSQADRRRMKSMAEGFEHQPKFSFVMPVFDPPPDLLAQCIDAMLEQNYPNFEICIADDGSRDPRVRATLEHYTADSRVNVSFREQNGHISAASNTALSLATGDYIVLVDHDDLIPFYCLFVVAFYINKNPNAKILYSDEDKISVDGKHSVPYMKSRFNKFLMYGHNQISHLGVYERNLVSSVGGFRMGLEGSQDYDLALRCLEAIDDDQIIHMPHVLYHWRTIPGSTSLSPDQKSYAVLAAQSAINGQFERTDLPLRSKFGVYAGSTAVGFTKEQRASLSIVIPTRDGVELLKPCLRSILEQNFLDADILVIDNGSEKDETKDYLATIAKHPKIAVMRIDEPFNFSRLNNLAAARCHGDLLCFLNNDTEVLSVNWLDRARGLLAMDDVGVVGARLLYPDQTIQHFGLVTGMGEQGVAGHPHYEWSAQEPGYFGKARMIAEYSAVTAACLFIRRAVFEEIGGFEEVLSVAYNDVDLCLKVRRAGYRVLADPEIELLHKESRTRGRDDDDERKDRLNGEADLMHARWPDGLLNDPFYSPNLALDRPDFAFAFPPRVLPPWMTDAEDHALPIR